jgi:hypothetical protein
MAELGLPAEVRPVMPEERLVLDRAIRVLRYRGEKMHRVDAVVTGSSGSPGGVNSVRIGSGLVLSAPLPVELADEIEPAAALYRMAMKAASVKTAITTTAGTGVVIHPAMYNGAVLYTLLSETDVGGDVTFTHAAAGVTVSSNLRAGGASLVLVDRKGRNVLAAYPEGAASRLTASG